jgi:DhnA family fructose-bisphosphate aldolase class Ia
MMGAGIKIRGKRLFNKESGMSLTVALDHGAFAGPLKGIESPIEVVRECFESGVDAILTTKGVVRATAGEWPRDVALIYRLTGGFTLLGGGFREEVISEAETALRYGASYGALTVKFGHPDEGRLIKQASLAIDQCHALGLPVMLEVMAKGRIDGKEFPPNDPQAIKMIARMGSELGADVIKTYYTGSRETFREVVAGCPVPILVLGGEEGRGKRQLLEEVKGSLEAGGRGVAIGRNIWSSGETAAMLQALKGIVHTGWSVEEAYARVSSK